MICFIMCAYNVCISKYIYTANDGNDIIYIIDICVSTLCDMWHPFIDEVIIMNRRYLSINICLYIYTWVYIYIYTYGIYIYICGK